MKIVKFFRKTYNGDEFLIEEDGKLKRIKKINKEIISNFRDFSIFLNLISYVDEFLKPERFFVEEDFYTVVFPYYGENEINIEKLSVDSKDLIAYKMLNIAQQVFHIPTLSFPVFSYDDILLNENDVIIQPPIWLSKNIVPPKNFRTFVAPEFEKEFKFSDRSVVYVFGKALEGLDLENEFFRSIIPNMVKEELNERTIHFVAPSLYQTFVNDEFVIPIIERPELYKILELVNEKSYKFIGVVGDQRLGKTTLLNMLQDRLQMEGKIVLRPTSITQLVNQLLQVAAGKVADEVLEELFNMIKNGGKIDVIVPLVGEVMDSIGDLFILVDDYQEKFDNFKAFLKELILLNFVNKHQIIAFSTEVFDEFEFIIDVNKFSKDDIKKILKKSFVKINGIDILTDFLFKISSGYPGILVEVLKLLVEKRILVKNIEKRVWECDFDRLSYTNIDQVYDISQNLDEDLFLKAKNIAILGQKFTDEELELLEEVCDISFQNLVKLLEGKGILYREYNVWRFTLRQYWEKFYEKIDDKEHMHKKLIEKYSKITFFGVYQKIAWHYKMLNQESKAIIYYIKSIRRGLEEYYSPNLLLYLISETEKLIPKDKILYTLLRFKLEVYRRVFKEVDFEIPDENIFEYLKILKMQINFQYDALKKYFEEDKERLNGYGLVGSYWRKLLYYQTLYVLEEYEKIDLEVLQKISDIPCTTSFVCSLKIGALLLLGNFYSQRNRLLSDFYFEKAKNIAKKNKIYHLLSIVYKDLSFNTSNMIIADNLLDKSIQYAEKAGLSNIAILSTLDKIRIMLYMGQIDKFFIELNKVRKIAKLRNLKPELASTYSLEVLYHIYNREFEEGYNDLQNFKRILDTVSIRGRYLRTLIMLYLFSERFTEAKKIYENVKDKSVFRQYGFDYFLKLAFAKSLDEFEMVWKEYRDSEIFLWREEIYALLGDKIAEVDPDGFFEQLNFLEREYSSQGLKLSLALLYEGYAKYYKVIGKSYKHQIYMSKVYSLYKEMGFKNYLKIIEKKNDFLKPFFEKSLNISKFIDSENISKSLKGYFEKANLSINLLEELKAIEEIEDPQNLLNYFAGKIVQYLPVTDVYIFVEDRQIEKKYKFSNTDDILQEDGIFSDPLKIKISDRVDKYLHYEIYVSNPLLSVTQENLYNILDFLEIIEYGFVTSLKTSILKLRSFLDPLTKLYTRYYFIEKLSQMFRRAIKFNEKLSVVMCDLDHFKKINDTYGHLIGDEVLKKIAQILRRNVRMTDVIGRYGGEEFIIFLPYSSSKQAYEIAERIRKKIEKLDEFPFKVTMSFGIASYPETKVNSPDELIHHADDALYKAKETGRNKVVMFNER